LRRPRAIDQLFGAMSCFVLLALVPSFVVPPLPAGRYFAHRPIDVRAQYSGDTSRGLEGLAPAQQKAFVEATATPDFAVTLLLEADSESWDRLRATYPALADLTDQQLADTTRSYVETPPSLVEALLKTPIGPVLGINLVLWATGFSACDLPFVDSGSRACMELAARTAASG
jgi:hypothetical protein